MKKKRNGTKAIGLLIVVQRLEYKLQTDEVININVLISFITKEKIIPKFSKSLLLFDYLKF